MISRDDVNNDVLMFTLIYFVMFIMSSVRRFYENPKIVLRFFENQATGLW